MDEADPQDRVQAAKDHLKRAVDDLHSATKAKAAQFQHTVEDAWSEVSTLATNRRSLMVRTIRRSTLEPQKV